MRFLPLALLALASCGPIVQIGGGDEPPPSLLNLRAEAQPASAGQVDPANTLSVDRPSVPGALQTLRLPVLTRDTQIAYLKQANWIEQPSRLFQQLLADVIGARTRVAIVDPRQSDVAPARKLTGQLLDFGLDARDPAAPVVRIRYDATLTGREGRLHAQRRFETTRPVAVQTGPAVGAALNAAANELASDVAAWVAAN